MWLLVTRWYYVWRHEGFGECTDEPYTVQYLHEG